MDPVPEATLVAGRGLVGNADQGRRRQVTLIEREVWDRLMRELGGAVPPSARRANLMVSGCSLAGDAESGAPGRRLPAPDRWARPGRASGWTRRFEGLREAMKPEWGGGSFGEVLDDGAIAVGAEVRWE